MTILEIILLSILIYITAGIAYVCTPLSSNSIDNSDFGALNTLLVILLWPICLILYIYIDIKIFINKRKKHE